MRANRLLRFPGPAVADGPRQAAPPIVSVRGLTKRFPARRPLGAWLRHPRMPSAETVLHEITLDVPRGGFFGLLGPNGAGKTTLFKILATLIRPDAGAVEIDGRDAATDPAGVRRVLTPVIADERSLYWRLSGRENLRLYAALYGVRGERRDREVGLLLSTVGLEAAADRMVGTYSSGMKQRLLIARALLSRPSVLLLDEPTRSLDPVSARDFRRFLREEVAERQGCTVVLATHDADEAFELCERLAVLDRGRLVATGTTEELARAAANERCRVTVPGPAAAKGVRVLAHAGFAGFDAFAAMDGDWAVLEGPAVGGSRTTAQLNAVLMNAGVHVAGIEPVRLALADLIERLVAGAPPAVPVLVGR
jgi:ABC-2 type transport system ATP-binding protein